MAHGFQLHLESRLGLEHVDHIGEIVLVDLEGCDIAGRREVRHPPQSGWLDERGRLKGGHSGSSVVALWRAGRKAAGKALRPPPVCVVQGTTAYRRPTAPAVTFALFNRDWRGCDKGFQGNGQTSSSLTGRTSGLPFVQLARPWRSSLAPLRPSPRRG